MGADSPNRDTALEHLRHLIDDVKIAMLTTVDPSGALRSRPMMTQAADDDGTLWFFSAEDSAKVDELVRRPAVNVSYANAERGVVTGEEGGTHGTIDLGGRARLDPGRDH